MSLTGDIEDETSVCPCRKEIPGSLWIVCGECETGWHPACCGLDGLTQSPINKLIGKKWKCPRCFKFPEGIPGTANNAENKKPISDETLSEIVSIVSSTVEENLKTLLSQENLSPEDSIEGPSDEGFTEVNRRRRQQQNSIQKAIEEQRQEEILIEKKKDSLIIYGMPETDTEDKKQEMLEDFRRIKLVYNGNEELAKEDITYNTRLGKKDRSKIRPIKITLANQEKRKELLTKNKNLQLLENNTVTNIYVSTDRTKKQREADKLLRDELKIRRLTDKNLVIRNNKIVPFRQEAGGFTSWASVLE